MGASILRLRCSDLDVVSSYVIATTRRNRFVNFDSRPSTARGRGGTGTSAVLLLRRWSSGDRAVWQRELGLGFGSVENREELGSTLRFIGPRIPYLMRRLELISY
jgi:hypothetical protein